MQKEIKIAGTFTHWSIIEDIQIIFWESTWKLGGIQNLKLSRRLYSIIFKIFITNREGL